MFGAIKAQFINAEDQTYNIDGREITAHYITIIDEHARSMQNRYTQLKVSDDFWNKLNLNSVSKIHEYQGKMCTFHGIWEMQFKKQKLSDGSSVSIPSWGFHVQLIKEEPPESKKA